MASPEDKARHSRHRKAKQKERLRSMIAKDLVTSGKYRQRIVVDKRRKEHDLSRMTHKDLVELIQHQDQDEE